MRKSYLIATVAGLLLALGGAAQAGKGGPGPGGGGGLPSGFSSGNPNSHGGFESFPTNTTPSTSTKLPDGWDAGKAEWKQDLQPNGLPSGPPGFNH